MAQAAGRLGVPVRFALATTITELTSIPVEAAYIRIECASIDARLVFADVGTDPFDGEAVGTDFETYPADVAHYRAVDQNLEQDDLIGIAGASGTPTVEVTFMRQGK